MDKKRSDLEAGKVYEEGNAFIKKVLLVDPVSFTLGDKQIYRFGFNLGKKFVVVTLTAQLEHTGLEAHSVLRNLD